MLVSLLLRSLALSVAASPSIACGAMADLEAPQVVLHTTMGDITVEVHLSYSSLTNNSRS